jgi:GT2 family glycosyltransferase
MLLNNDTVLPDNSISDMLSFMDSDTSIGAASPKICFYSDNHIIQYAGYTEMSTITLRNKGIGYKEADDGSFDDTSETYFAHGAAMMVRLEAIEAAGLMPEEYFLYYEEIDWSYRIREAGYSIWYYPHAKVLHKESATVGADTPLKSFYITRNRFLLAGRNRRGLVRYLSYLYLGFISVPKSLFKSFLSGRLDLVKAILKGFVNFILTSVT